MTFEEPHLIEEHAEHHLVGLFRQVGQEEDLVGGCVVHVATTTSMTCRPGRLRLLVVFLLCVPLVRGQEGQVDSGMS